MAEIVREFVKEKETKNTVKYDEKPPTGQPPVIGSLYLQKWAASGASKITVTVAIPE